MCSGLRDSCKLHLVIKSVLSRCQPPPPYIPLPIAIFLSNPSLPCSVAGRLDLKPLYPSLWRLSHSPRCKEHCVSLCLYGNLIEESWKDLSACSGKEGQRSSSVPLTIWRNSHPTSSNVCVALLPSTGKKGNCQETWGVGETGTRDSLRVWHQWEFIPNQWEEHCSELLTYDTFCQVR